MNITQFDELFRRSGGEHHIDALCKSGVTLLSAIESPDGSDTDTISIKGGYLRYAVLNASHRYRIVTEFTAKPDVGIVLMNRSPKVASCKVRACRKLNRKEQPRPYTGRLSLTVNPEWGATGQQDETIRTTPTIHKYTIKDEMAGSDTWSEMENTFDVLPINTKGNEYSYKNTQNGGYKKMIDGNMVFSAALGVIFNEFWQFVKDIFGPRKDGDEKPTLIAIGNVKLELSSSGQEFQKLIKREFDEVLTNQIKSKTQSFKKACNYLIELERQVDGQAAGDESPVKESTYNKQKEKAQRIAKELKTLMERAVGGEIVPL